MNRSMYHSFAIKKETIRSQYILCIHIAVKKKKKNVYISDYQHVCQVFYERVLFPSFIVCLCLYSHGKGRKTV